MSELLDGNADLYKAVVGNLELSEYEREEIQARFTKLSERELYVLHRRFAMNGCTHQTLRQIGHDLSLSPERIRQIEYRGLERLRWPLRARRYPRLYE
jgi:DNA-directed RNA polymerase sigma subunit (sigma70/sigma32)